MAFIPILKRLLLSHNLIKMKIEHQIASVMMSKRFVYKLAKLPKQEVINPKTEWFDFRDFT